VGIWREVFVGDDSIAVYLAKKPSEKAREISERFQKNRKPEIFALGEYGVY
jgi:hypothetical protein